MISVIIPVFCSEKYLGKCIESVVDQIYNDLEIILVDDGSTDNSPTICDDWAVKDRRIKVFHQRNSGVSAARNIGLKNACGEYVMFLDSDDWLDKRACEMLVSCSADVELVIGSYILRMSKGGFVVKRILAYYGMIEEFVLVFEKYLKAQVIQAPWGKLYKKNIIDSYDIKFDTEMSFGEDTKFVYEYMSHVNKVSVIDYPILNINQTNGSLSRVFRKDKFNLYLDSVKNFEKFCHVRNFNNNDKLINRMKCYAYSSFVTDVWRCEDKDLAVTLIKQAAMCEDIVNAYRLAADLPLKYVFLKYLTICKLYTVLYYLSKLRHYCVKN